jgi:hypothetical protein
MTSNDKAVNVVWERLLVGPDSVLLVDDDQVAEQFPGLDLYEQLRRAGVPMPAGPGPVELLVSAAAELVVLRADDADDALYLLPQEAGGLVVAWYRNVLDTVQPEQDQLLTADQRELHQELERQAAPTREVAAAAEWVYGSPQDLVLDLGRFFVRGARFHRVGGISGAANAAREVHGRLYVEGYVLTYERMAKPDAWAAVGDEVIAGPDALAYLGVPIAEPYRRRVTRNSLAASVLHGQQYHDWRLLRAGLPPEASPASK